MEARRDRSSGRYHGGGMPSSVARGIPGLAIESLGYLAEGWDSTVFEVNGSHVFRFPKRAGVDATLRKEIRLVPALIPTLAVPIPAFEFVSGPTTIYAWHIVGYQKLAGTPADNLGWAPDAGAAIAPALAAFLRALHTFLTDRAVELGAPAFTPRAWMDRHAALYANARAVAEPRLPADVFARFVADWEQMLADRARLDFEPMLIHGDLAMEHLLVDADGQIERRDRLRRRHGGRSCPRFLWGSRRVGPERPRPVHR